MIEEINVSIGELWDKFTILLIKKEKITNEEKLKIVLNEISFLQPKMDKYEYLSNNNFINLKETNLKLWEVEDKLRIKETEKRFDNEFILLARRVYYLNDIRSEFKGKINNEFGSKIGEVKDYINYNKIRKMI